MAASEINRGQDEFTPEFKRLKGRKPSPNLQHVIDLHHIVCDMKEDSRTTWKRCASPDHSEVLIEKCMAKSCSQPIAGLKPCEEWQVFQFLSHPGFYVILNPFVDGYQRYWVSRCLTDFPSDAANVTNMSGQEDFKYSDVWDNFMKKSTFEKHDPLRKLRWTTLGYHHNWNTKEYSERSKATFPADVHALSEYIVSSLGFTDFKAEAAIVNYYHMDSTLAGHTDHSEIDHSAPLVSISFGQTAIFLLGGETKSTKPVSVYLRSGDICVMSGPSRLAYHAVPKILPAWSQTESERIQKAFTFSHKSDISQTTDALSAKSTSSDKNKAESQHQIEFNNVGFQLQPGNVVKISACNQTTMHSSSSQCIRDAVKRQKMNTDGLNTDLSNKEEDLCNIEKAQQDKMFTNCEVGRNLNKSPLRNVSQPSMCLNKEPFVDTAKLSHSTNFCVKELNYQILKATSTIDFKPLQTYLNSSRINMNIRQVLPPGVNSLSLDATW